MSGDKEYIIDIVEEIRDYAEHRDFDSDGNVSTTMLRVFADRIEAAARRERGNAEQMREALCEILYVSEKYMKNCPHISGMIHTGIAAKCRTAIAAPQKPLRNCDRYSHDEALEIWAAEKENGYNGCFDEWLYSTAKTEGGAE